MAVIVRYNDQGGAELQRDVYGVLRARHKGYIANVSDIEGVTPETAMAHAALLLPALQSPYPKTLGPLDARLIAHNLRASVTQPDCLDFELVYERAFATSYVSNDLRVTAEYGSFEFLDEPVAQARDSQGKLVTVPLFLGGLFSKDNPELGGPPPRIVRARRAVPVSVTELSGLYLEPNLPLYLRDYTGTVNNDWWNGKPTAHWLCETVQMSRVELYNNQILVKVILKLRLDRDWSTFVGLEDPFGNTAPPDQRVLDAPYKYGVQPDYYADEDYDADQLNRRWSSILKIGPFPTKDFVAAFGGSNAPNPAYLDAGAATQSA